MNHYDEEFKHSMTRLRNNRELTGMVGAAHISSIENSMGIPPHIGVTEIGPLISRERIFFLPLVLGDFTFGDEVSGLFCSFLLPLSLLMGERGRVAEVNSDFLTGTGGSGGCTGGVGGGGGGGMAIFGTLPVTSRST